MRLRKVFTQSYATPAHLRLVYGALPKYCYAQNNISLVQHVKSLASGVQLFEQKLITDLPSQGGGDAEYAQRDQLESVSPKHNSSICGVQVDPTDKAANARTKVVVGMSGGVDSSVVALLLLQQGYNVEGLFMQNWDTRDEQGHCSVDEDYKDMLDVCRKLNIKGHRVSFVKEYWNDVFEGFLQSYEKGHTPNPDIFCNKEIKFKAFLRHAVGHLGADMIATGHYAQRIPSADGRGWQLAMGLDQGKDQSYFLSAINRACLDKVLFPIGHLLKPRVRELAAEAGLSVATKKDSTGICFVGKRHFPEFISNYIAPTPGPIVELESGRQVGKHTGIHTRTLGERSRISGAPESYYVVDKDVAANNLIVARGHNHPALYRNWLSCSAFYWMGNTADMPQTIRCQVRARYQQRLAWATLTRTKDEIRLPKCNSEDDTAFTSTSSTANVNSIEDPGDDESMDDRGLSIQCTFDNPHYCVTPGQMLVAYDGVVCLGGGVIDGLGPSLYASQAEIEDETIEMSQILPTNPRRVAATHTMGS